MGFVARGPVKPVKGWMSLLVLFLSAWPQAPHRDGAGQVAESPVRKEPTATTSYFYKLVTPNLTVVRAELQFDETGQGTFTFLPKNEEEEIRLPLKLWPQTVQRVNQYLEQLRFLTSEEVYQSNRDLSHLGTITLRVRRGSLEREVIFNYTTHPVMRELAALLRGMVSQESRVFAIELARRHEPLDLDRQMQALQREVSNGWLAEPKKLIPLLEEIRSDEGVLLMARRRAGQIIRMIQKKS